MEPSTISRAQDVSRKRRLLITGAAGYIGRRLVDSAMAAGHDVVATVRPGSLGVPLKDNPSMRPFDLGRPESLVETFPDVDGVIHLAVDLTAGESQDQATQAPGEDVNVKGTRRLLEAARANGVRRFIFMSSQSAREDAPSHYGRSKWAIEQLLSEPGDVIVRPGMVTGGPTRGLYGVLYRLCRTAWVFPMLRGSAPVYPVHVDDLCGELLRMASEPLGTSSAVPDVRVVAPTQPMRFADYVQSIATERVGRRVRMITVPAAVALLATRVSAWLPGVPRVSPERVLGLMALQPYANDARAVPAARLRDVSLQLAEEGQRRRLLLEGRTLLTYILGRPPSSSVLRRYVRAMDRESDPTPLDVPGFAQRWPRTLRFVESVHPPVALKRRLTIATRVAEMTLVGAQRFHNYQSRSLPVTLLSTLGALGIEALLMPVRLVAHRWGPKVRPAARRDPGRPPGQPPGRHNETPDDLDAEAR